MTWSSFDDGVVISFSMQGRQVLGVVEPGDRVKLASRDRTGVPLMVDRIYNVTTNKPVIAWEPPFWRILLERLVKLVVAVAVPVLAAAVLTLLRSKSSPAPILRGVLPDAVLILIGALALAVTVAAFRWLSGPQRSGQGVFRLGASRASGGAAGHPGGSGVSQTGTVAMLLIAGILAVGAGYFAAIAVASL